MAIRTVAIISPGEMGSAVGKALGINGYRIVSSLSGRSEATRARAAAAGFEDAGSLADVVKVADIILSILPPEFAVQQAEMTAAVMNETKTPVLYVDCNAVAPATAQAIADTISAAGAKFIDAGIVGNPPGKVAKRKTKLFVSGPHSELLQQFSNQFLAVRQCGTGVGSASAVKMAYAGITKGTSALHTAMLLAAERLGVADELHRELQESQAATYTRMENMTSALPAVSDRYVGEMLEIAKTMASCDMPSDFHQGAADLYRILNASPFARERRDTVDTSRTLRQTVEICARTGLSDVKK